MIVIQRDEMPPRAPDGLPSWSCEICGEHHRSDLIVGLAGANNYNKDFRTTFLQCFRCGALYSLYWSANKADRQYYKTVLIGDYNDDHPVINALIWTDQYIKIGSYGKLRLKQRISVAQSYNMYR